MCSRCTEELFSLAAVAYDAFKTDVNVSQDTITDELLAKHFPTQSMLRRLVATFGLIRAGLVNYAESVDDCSTGTAGFVYGTTIRFIHRSYYEYFVALHIVETICISMDACSNFEEGAKADERLQEIQMVLSRKDPRYMRVKQYAAGLVSLPTYCRAAELFLRYSLEDSMTNRSVVTENNDESIIHLGIDSSLRSIVENRGTFCVTKVIK